MSYPEGLSAAAMCAVDGGCIFRGGSVCVRCGTRLRCGCGQFVREDGFDAHIGDEDDPGPCSWRPAVLTEEENE